MTAKERRYPVFPFRYPASHGSEEIRKLEQAERKERTVETVDFDVECSVSVPDGVSGAQVLLLVQFPGREYRPSRCTAQVDGAPSALKESNSGEHVGYYVASKDNFWKDMLPHECEWCWYIAEVAPGTHQVRFTGRAGHAAPKLGLWAWAEHDLTAGRIPLPAPATEPAMPNTAPETERQGICILKP